MAIATIAGTTIALIGLVYFNYRSDRMAVWEADKDYYQQCQTGQSLSTSGCQALEGKSLRPPPFSSNDSFVTILKRMHGDLANRFRMIRPQVLSPRLSDPEAVREDRPATHWALPNPIFLLVVSILVINGIRKAYTRSRRTGYPEYRWRVPHIPHRLLPEPRDEGLDLPSWEIPPFTRIEDLPIGSSSPVQIRNRKRPLSPRELLGRRLRIGSIKGTLIEGSR